MPLVNQRSARHGKLDAPLVPLRRPAPRGSAFPPRTDLPAFTTGKTIIRFESQPLQRVDGAAPHSEIARQMVKRRAEETGFDPDPVTCHPFRGTGIKTYLENGGELETAQHIAGHHSAATTKLYDRRQQTVEQEEIERIHI